MSSWSRACPSASAISSRAHRAQLGVAPRPVGAEALGQRRRHREVAGACPGRLRSVGNQPEPKLIVSSADEVRRDVVLACPRGSGARGRARAARPRSTAAERDSSTGPTGRAARRSPRSAAGPRRCSRIAAKSTSRTPSAILDGDGHAGAPPTGSTPARGSQRPAARGRHARRGPAARARRRRLGQDARAHPPHRLARRTRAARATTRSSRSPSPTRPRRRCASASSCCSAARVRGDVGDDVPRRVRADAARRGRRAWATRATFTIYDQADARRLDQALPGRARGRTPSASRPPRSTTRSPTRRTSCATPTPTASSSARTSSRRSPTSTSSTSARCTA